MAGPRSSRNARRSARSTAGCARKTGGIDLTFGPDGSLYVAELDEASWAAVEILQAPTGGTINACDVATLICGEVASGIPILTAITFGKDGTLWATRNALIPGQAEVFEVF